MTPKAQELLDRAKKKCEPVTVAGLFERSKAQLIADRASQLARDDSGSDDLPFTIYDLLPGELP